MAPIAFRIMLPAAPGCFFFLPVHHHAGLRQSERKKRSHREERDQPVGNTVEANQQKAGQDGQQQNTFGENQSAAAHREE